MTQRHEKTIEEKIKEIRLSFVKFVKFTKPDYNVEWFHEAVCHKLELFAAGRIKKLMINIPPQHGKSELSSRRFPAWMLGLDPTKKIALTSYGATHAQAFNRDVQRIIDNDAYRVIFPNTTLNSRNVATTSRGSWRRTADIFDVVGHGGFLKTVGRGGALTGTTVDIGIIDDIYKDRAEAKSQVVRNAAWEFYVDVFETRLHNDSQQLVLNTRWDVDDLNGRILDRDGLVSEGGEWELVVFPAIKDDESNPEDPREIGEALWESRHSLERLEKVRDRTPVTFNSLYQQRPAPVDGNIIKESYFVKLPYEKLPLGVREGVKDFAVDTAYTDKKSNDPSAILAYILYENYLYLYDYSNVRRRFSDLKRFLRLFVKAVGDHSSRVYIEPKANGESITQELEDDSDLNVIRYKLPPGDKLSRTNANEPYLEARRVVLVEAPWNQSFIEECKVFPNSPHDEAVDLLNMAITQGLVRGNVDIYDGDADYA